MAMTLEDVVRELDALRNTVGVLLLDRKPLLNDRVYEIGQIDDTKEVEKVDGKEIFRNVEHAVGDACPPGATWQYNFGTNHDIPGTGIKGLPETIEKCFGTENVFLFESFEIDDECAEYFDIEAIYIGSTSMWGYCVVPGTRFAKSAPKVIFKKASAANVILMVQVKNKSSEPRVFRARFIGKEPQEQVSVKSNEPDAR